MIFNKILGIQNINKNEVRVIYREAVRAIIIKDNKLLMVHSNKGDYKFPGGGIEKGENYEETLKREVEEETGYILSNVKEKIGMIIERNKDQYEEDAVFEMISHYYLCEIFGKKTKQQLDDYEAELEFLPTWMDLEKAITENEACINKEDKNFWIGRETFVLNQLKELF